MNKNYNCEVETVKFVVADIRNFAEECTNSDYHLEDWTTADRNAYAEEVLDIVTEIEEKTKDKDTLTVSEVEEIIKLIEAVETENQEIGIDDWISELIES